MYQIDIINLQLFFALKSWKIVFQVFSTSAVVSIQEFSNKIIKMVFTSSIIYICIFCNEQCVSNFVLNRGELWLVNITYNIQFILVMFSIFNSIKYQIYHFKQNFWINKPLLFQCGLTYFAFFFIFYEIIQNKFENKLVFDKPIGIA